ncbi:DUF5998 family protein [Glutamicibacter bergerei]|jgi:hypothetical protein|uniref:DUF5998 family protein n=2 Tax=Glutamicibacter TaxID=1742989 RepID=A0ABV9MSD8_9MICC|nr:MULTISPECIES: DUF5998 family protein [Micrococcaceae]HAY42750.1 cell wall biosynthesis glycosyltransferase [Micrococcaceae bacterium]PCC37006.1 cell wall biosynthesis glycosyltransferase [Glutamicibacter sp. BW77]PRB72152.1 cell wall biosynthesis glycosyltransferase [Arthrobacter sp. MYb213]GGJ62994.1 hypothetical protein GCM10007173_22340 [Glutamicibacter ardleyensis]HBV10326.1 cell wall biosynthesis glycosyltransferase [Micrococcaceae bacterium]
MNSPTYSTTAGAELQHDLVRAGFYPQMVQDVLAEAMMSQPVLDHYVHLETHFDHNEVHRHITVMVLSEKVLYIIHVDDQQLDDHGKDVMAQVSTEMIALHRIASVATNYVYHQPQHYRTGDEVRELTFGMSWNGTRRIDLEPASCADPQCDADHGLSGTAQPEDLVIRVSAEADGQRAVNKAREFAVRLRHETI